MTANTLRLKILPGSLISLSVKTGKEKKRCQPSPGATLRNKVVSNHGQNQPCLVTAPPLFGPPVPKTFWTLILASQSCDPPSV